MFHHWRVHISSYFYHPHLGLFKIAIEIVSFPIKHGDFPIVSILFRGLLPSPVLRVVPRGIAHGTTVPTVSGSWSWSTATAATGPEWPGTWCGRRCGAGCCGWPGMSWSAVGGPANVGNPWKSHDFMGVSLPWNMGNPMISWRLWWFVARIDDLETLFHAVSMATIYAAIIYEWPEGNPQNMVFECLWHGVNTSWHWRNIARGWISNHVLMTEHREFTRNLNLPENVGFSQWWSMVWFKGFKGWKSCFF